MRFARSRRPAGAAVLAITLLLCSSASAQAPVGTPWLSYGRTADVQNAAATPITVAEAKRFTTKWTVKLGDGMLTAQPLYVPSATVAGRTEAVVIAATAGNVVYALDARTGARLWQRSLGPTLPQVCQGQGGVESTPAIDLATARIYVLGANGNVVALELSTGKPVPGWSVSVIRRTDVETAWGALRIAAGKLYVPVASWCDTKDAAGAWDGRLVQIALATHRIAGVFDVVPGKNNGGGIWGPGGVSIDPKDGSIWTATANAVVENDGNLAEGTPLAERVVHLSTSLRVIASVQEPDTNPAERGDQGFGATPMLFQPAGCPPLLAVNSKDLYTYVWRRDALSAPPILRQKLAASSNSTFYAQPTWFPSTHTLVVDGARLPNGAGANGIVGFRLTSKCTFAPAWGTNIGGGVEPQPLAAGRVAFVAATSVSKLYAVDSQTGLLLAELPTGQAEYTAPMVAGKNVVVGTAAGDVIAFGPR